jgi:hypothetical protein
MGGGMSGTKQLDERVVAEIWERQSFDPVILQALDLQVVYRGVPADAGGPDYQDAILAAASGSIIRGDIEFHVRSSDWDRHGHSRDKNYNRVVLHVVWIHDASATLRADGTQVPVLTLCEADDTRRNLAMGAMLPHPCIATFSRLGGEDLYEALASLGMQRFWERRDRFAADLTEQTPDQVIYASLLESLGYASNREAFRQLAGLLPYEWLAALRPDQMAGALIEASGLDGASGGLGLPRLPFATWRLTRIRPQNHPGRRLLGIGTLLSQMRPSPAEYLCQAVFEAQRPSDLRRRLLARQDETSYIGAGRADEIAVSAVLPFVAAMAESTRQAEELYKRYPAPPANRWTRSMIALFETAGHRIQPRPAPVHQGIHLLYHRYCRAERTERCPLCRAAGPVTLRG